MDTDSNVNPADRPHTVYPAEEMELSDLDQGPTSADIDQALSEEQTFRETMREALDSFMGWKHIPELDTATSEADDLPFVGPKLQPVGKISVNMLGTRCSG